MKGILDIIGMSCCSVLLLLFVLILIVKTVVGKRERKEFNAKVDDLTRRAIEGKLPADADTAEVFYPTVPGDAPTMPMIVTGKRGGVDILLDAKTSGKASMLALLDNLGHYFRHYAADGRLWTMNVIYRAPRSQFMARLLAEIGYNPLVEYRSTWQCERTYTLYELREMLCLCVDLDDDCLTQYTEPDELQTCIRNATTFDQLLDALARTRAVTGLQRNWRKKIGRMPPPPKSE
ncbi:MAG: hypothetical protein ACYC6A_15675 [Armatimonadota bacterium]